jgi:phospholipase C
MTIRPERPRLAAALVAATLSAAAIAATGLAATSDSGSAAAPVHALTPIDHLIVIVGENYTFDSLFATYVPRSGAAVRNLLSAGIVDRTGSPGPEFQRALQRRASAQTAYSLDPPRAQDYEHLPQPRLIGVQDQHFHDVGNAPDPRFPADLPSGPFPISRFVPYPSLTSTPTLASATADLSAATGDPVHRFFQMWQQTGGDNAKLDLYTWVATTVGMGGDTAGVTAADTGQGGELMGFLDMQRGDAPYLRSLADRYAISDNYHQSIMGGTGMNFFALATADSPVYAIDGRLATPPQNQIENPDPMPGSENFYREDGYAGGSYVNCSDPRQPGVAAILAVLAHKGVASRCAPGAYYLVNNYGAGYDVDGHQQPLGPNNFNYPPQTVPTIAEALSAAGIGWKWYTGARDGRDVATEMARLHLSLDAARRLQYNDIGDPLVASTAVMSRPPLRAGLAGLRAFDEDVAHGRVPAVSFLVPKNLDSGHPGYSVIASYEDFLQHIIGEVQAHRDLWAHTAIVATTDEGGGHFDSGYIQVLDFFGDGPRIPLLLISPYSKPGHVDHVYSDHSSILKFIERNWGLAPLSARSRDNFPNPVTKPDDPYRPTNGPAVGDLMSLFQF